MERGGGGREVTARSLPSNKPFLDRFHPPDQHDAFSLAGARLYSSCTNDGGVSLFVFYTSAPAKSVTSAREDYTPSPRRKKRGVIQPN